MRKEEESSDIHFFSTQFFQKIQDQGAESVQSWTRRRKINIFQKKFIFIPINDYLHWSLCVVVNPGKIRNMYRNRDDEDCREEKLDFPFILFLDSLKAHQKTKVKTNIYNWLNLEAERLSEFQDISSESKKGVFNTYSIPLVAPKIPYQNNGWDCGVFVCRYALGVLALRNSSFQADVCIKKKDRPATVKLNVGKIIAECKGFDFDMRDIARLREEFATLIDRLSDTFNRKEEERKKMKLKLKNEKEEQKENPEVTNSSNQNKDDPQAGDQVGDQVGDCNQTRCNNESCYV